MLRNVLASYLDSIKEREFDVPLMALLHAMGFHDVHFTHGQVEFGKDFIAKKSLEGKDIQYSFQLKASDISHSIWRNALYGQVLEAFHSNLVHPNFEPSLPHQMVLATTGKLSGNAALAIRDMNQQIAGEKQGLPIEIWDKNNLIELLNDFGIEGIHSSTSSDIVNKGEFYSLLGKSMEGRITATEIEKYSRIWINTPVDQRRKVIWSAIETELIAKNCENNNDIYLVIQAKLAFARLLLVQIWLEEDRDELEQLIGLYNGLLVSIKDQCVSFISSFEQDWYEAEKDLLRLVDGPGLIISYLVHCSRILEIIGLGYFLETDQGSRDHFSSLLEEFVSSEPGCGHLPSDVYSVSLIPTILSLLSQDKCDVAIGLLKSSLVWLCDRFEEGDGISQLGNDPLHEVETLFGHPFDFFPESKKSGSFLATLIGDLAALLGNIQFFKDFVNDIQACKIFPIYWQVSDTDGQFIIEGDDVVTYPNVTFFDDSTTFEDYKYSDHIIHEPRNFKLINVVGPVYSLLLALLLRDRYFPTIWPELIQR